LGEFCEFMKGENGLCKTRGWPGCQEITVALEGNVMNLWQRWDTKASWEAYFAWRGEIC